MCDVDGFVFQAEDGIRDLVRSRGLGDVYKRQELSPTVSLLVLLTVAIMLPLMVSVWSLPIVMISFCLLYTSDAADERSSVDLGGRRIIKKKTDTHTRALTSISQRIAHLQIKRHTTQKQYR